MAKELFQIVPGNAIYTRVDDGDYDAAYEAKQKGLEENGYRHPLWMIDEEMMTTCITPDQTWTCVERHQGPKNIMVGNIICLRDDGTRYLVVDPEHQRPRWGSAYLCLQGKMPGTFIYDPLMFKDGYKWSRII